MKNHPNFLSALLATGILFSFTGCSTVPKTDKYSSLVTGSSLQPDPRFPRSQVFIADSSAFGQYSEFIVDPVAIYQGPGASWHGTDEPTCQQKAQFVHDEFVRVLGAGYKVVDQPGDRVLRLKFTLVDLEATKPVLSTTSHLFPVGLAINMGKGMTDHPGSFMGSATLAGELTDSQTGEVIAAFLTQQSPNAMDFTAVVNSTAAIDKAITETAEKFKAVVDRAHGQVQ